jgi:hypothetical protein
MSIMLHWLQGDVIVWCSIDVGGRWRAMIQVLLRILPAFNAHAGLARCDRRGLGTCRCFMSRCPTYTSASVWDRSINTQTNPHEAWLRPSSMIVLPRCIDMYLQGMAQAVAHGCVATCDIRITLARFMPGTAPAVAMVRLSHYMSVGAHTQIMFDSI